MLHRKMIFGVLIAGALAAAGAATASPAWATSPNPSVTSRGCRLTANEPNSNGSRVRGEGTRSNCSNTVTYFWVRVYRDIPFWPDSEEAVNGQNYVQNGKLTASGTCDGHGEYYTYTSTASGTSGDDVESGRTVLC